MWIPAFAGMTVWAAGDFVQLVSGAPVQGLSTSWRHAGDMISPASMSAFSSIPGLGNVQPADALRPFGRVDQAPTTTRSAPQGSGSSQPDAGSSPSRTLPRGSLLDMTV
jgi:hypothetical protein